MAPRAPLALLALAALLLCGEEATGAARDGARPRFHAATYASSFDQRLQLPLVTAERNGFYPVVVGYGKAARWAYGLSGLANSFRDFIFNRTQPEDVVMFFDAYDIMFLGREEQILDKYLELERRTGRMLFYNGDLKCTNPCKVEQPNSTTPWRHLNSGIYIGRSHVLRELYREPLPDPLVDEKGEPMRLQYWHVLFYMQHRDKVMVDADCELTQVVANVDNFFVHSFYPELQKMPGGHGLKLVGGRLVNPMTNSTPLVLHFPGWGHWPDWGHKDRVGTCAAYELFRQVGHPDLALLMEREHELQPLGLSPWRTMCSKADSFLDRAGGQLSVLGERLALVHYHAHIGRVAFGLCIACFVFYGICLLARCTLRRSLALIFSLYPQALAPPKPASEVE